MRGARLRMATAMRRGFKANGRIAAGFLHPSNPIEASFIGWPDAETPHFRGAFTLAERGGFEPPVQFNPYGSLANYWFKPLTHLSNSGGKYNRLFQLTAIPEGFEPSAACLEGRCSIQLSYGTNGCKELQS